MTLLVASAGQANAAPKGANDGITPILQLDYRPGGGVDPPRQLPDPALARSGRLRGSASTTVEKLEDTRYGALTIDFGLTVEFRLP